MTTVISVEGLGKQYRLGTLSRRSLKEDFSRWWADLWGKPDPFASLGNASSKGGSEIENETIWALKDVNFEVKQGEVVGIIGRNGAGKSTLLKILSRVTAPTSGWVKIKGNIASLLEVGTGFHPELTGRENIFLNGAILGMKRGEIEWKLDEIIDFSGVSKFIDTPVKRYSSGMYVRLAFAVAAHLDPEILLIDEVLAVGDADFQKKCLNKMEDVAHGGRTVLFVSHNMLAIQKMCSKAILLEVGRCQMFESVNSAVESYLQVSHEMPGELLWPQLSNAPGNHQVRLKAVRILCAKTITATPLVSQDIEVQVDYWNLEEGGRRLVSIWVVNAMGYCLFTSGNTPTASLVPDPWVEKKYPRGLFRTSCYIPKQLLNTGCHSIDLYINGTMSTDQILVRKSVISFDVQENPEVRKGLTSEWIGAVRPILHWETEQLE